MLKYLFSILVGFFIIQESSAKTITLSNNNFVSLIGPITKSSIDNVIRSLNDKYINEYIQENKQINIYINSPGGSVFAGNHLIQYVKMLQNNNVSVNCIGQNFMSMAFIIMQSCTKRYVLFDSIGMQHQISLGIKGNIENLKNYFSLIDRVNKILIKMEIKKINITESEYLSNILSDWWLYGFENVESNVADQLINIRCSQIIMNDKIKQKIDLNGILFSIESSKCPILNDIQVSDRNMSKYYDFDNYSFTVKQLLSEFKN
jgi:ATP-dependent Clp protease protease subunit